MAYLYLYKYVNTNQLTGIFSASFFCNSSKFELKSSNFLSTDRKFFIFCSSHFSPRRSPYPSSFMKNFSIFLNSLFMSSSTSLIPKECNEELEEGHGTLNFFNNKIFDMCRQTGLMRIYNACRYFTGISVAFNIPNIHLPPIDRSRFLLHSSLLSQLGLILLIANFQELFLSG